MKNVIAIADSTQTEQNSVSFIPYGRQSIDDDDITAVVDILKSDYITQGPSIEIFENNLAKYCQVQYGVACNSATSALHMACIALGVTEGDIVWTSPITFVASANCALYCGAEIDFVDIDDKTYNISVDSLAEKLNLAKQSNTLPKVIIAVHLSGQSCDMQGIHQLAQKYDIKIIEDASHGIGGQYQNGPIGNCKYSDITVFSFHPVKIITTGEGGMATTNDSVLADKLHMAKSHGITRDQSLMDQKADGAWYYQQLSLGYNYRMTDIQAALGNSQLKKVNRFVKRRRTIAARYDQQLADLPLTLPWQHPETQSATHLYIIRLQLNAFSKSRKQVFDSLRKNSIGVNVHYIPVHLQPYYQKLGFKLGDFPIAEQYYQEAISIPVFASMTNEEQNRVSLALQEALCG